jgi:hypothetical protein
MLLSKPRFSFPYLALVRVVMILSKAMERAENPSLPGGLLLHEKTLSL